MACIKHQSTGFCPIHFCDGLLANVIFRTTFCFGLILLSSLIYYLSFSHSTLCACSIGKNIRYLIEREDEPYCFRLHKDRVYYVSERLVSCRGEVCVIERSGTMLFFFVVAASSSSSIRSVSSECRRWMLQLLIC